MKKKFILVLIGFVLMFCNIIPVNAATGSIRVRASSTSVTIGNNVTITVTISSSAALGSWEFSLNYDTAKLRQTNTTLLRNVDVGDGTKTSTSYTYTFKTIATGTANVTVRNYSVLDWNTEEEISVTVTPVNVTIKQPVVIVKSSDNTLKSLTLSHGTLSPTFNSSTLEYTVDIDEIIDKITITPTANHSKASISGGGELELTEGLNLFEIKVTAENGSLKTYKVNVNMIDENPIEVQINNKLYTVVKKANVIEAPSGFIDTTLTIKGLDVPAFENSDIDLILVTLKDEDGLYSLYSYDESSEAYRKYIEFQTGLLRLYITNPSSTVVIPEGFDIAVFSINNIEITGWDINSNDNYKLVYAMNIDNGVNDFYLYDANEGTFQRYLDMEDEQEFDLTYYISIGSVALLLVLALILYIPLSIKMKKLLPNKRSK